MNMPMLLLLLLAAASVVPGQGRQLQKFNILRQQTRAAGKLVEGLNCLSWRVGVEANNIIGWDDARPWQCSDHLVDYLLGGQYGADIDIVVDAARHYASTLNLTEDNANIWVFDIYETVLSTVFQSLNKSSDEFSPEIRQTRKLYNEVLSLGIKVVFLTGRRQKYRSMTERDLKEAGYDTWFKFILRSDKRVNQTAKLYKSTIRSILEERGYRIVGNIGDQWSDITGPSPGWRVFKLPNPFYYVP